MDKATDLGTPVFFLFAAVIGMLILAVAIIFFFLIYQKRLSDQQEKIKTLEIEYQKELLKAILEAQESERKRIASDLHDSVGSNLSAIRLYLNQLKQEDQSDYFDNVKKETTGMIDLTIENVRSITRNLLPSSLEQFGLIAALEDLCRRINELDNLKVRFQCQEDRRLPPSAEIALYRVVQELINNTLKHAQAEHITVKVEMQDKFLNFHY